MSTVMAAFIVMMQLAVITDRDITFAWDYPELSAGVVDEFRIYVARDPAELVDLSLISPAAVTPVPNVSVMVVDVAPGQWYAVATAADVDTIQESPPSTIFPFFALGSPLNFRAIPTGVIP